MESKNNGAHLHVDKLQKKFGDAIVLDDIELTVKPGEFIAIVGRSGCGKSTLLRLISGLEETNEGGIYLNENKINGINLDIRYIFQEARLLPWRKIIDIEKGKITMDTKITLARPRERNNDFVYFERRILDRVMNRETNTLPREEYAI